MTLDKLQEYVCEWVNNVYHKTIHTRTGRAPILAWEDAMAGWNIPTFSEEEVDAIARRPEARQIHHGRVQVDNIEYFSHALSTLEAMGQKSVTVFVNELDLHFVYIQHPTDQTTLIRAESTDPDYTIGLTYYEHQEAQKIKNEMTQSDQKRLGRYCDLLARWHLFLKIQTDSTLAKRQIAKLTQGKGRSGFKAPKQFSRSEQIFEKIGQTTNDNQNPALLIINAEPQEPFRSDFYINSDSGTNEGDYEIIEKEQSDEKL